jgi:hypothetical protein
MQECKCGEDVCHFPCDCIVFPTCNSGVTLSLWVTTEVTCDMVTASKPVSCALSLVQWEGTSKPVGPPPHCLWPPNLLARPYGACNGSEPPILSVSLPIAYDRGGPPILSDSLPIITGFQTCWPHHTESVTVVGFQTCRPSTALLLASKLVGPSVWCLQW